MGEQQRRPKWGKILSSLSTVDRRLRDFCIASMRDQELSFSSYDIYTRKLQAINMDVSAGYMSRIGSLRIGLRSQVGHKNPPLGSELEFPFSSLRSVELWNLIPERFIMTVLSEVPLLEELVMLWPNNWSFPEVNLTPKIHTLRLNIIPNTHPAAKLERVLKDSPTAFPFITTLEIAHPRFTKWQEEFWLRLTFPNLRVICLQHTPTSVASIFDFIHHHPTVLEANLQFDIQPEDALPHRYDTDLSISLGAIIKLIDGTGSWLGPNGEDASYDIIHDGEGIELDQPLFYPEFGHTYSDEIPDMDYSTDTFAFKRIPVSPDATQWDKQEGSPEPRYHATELSVIFDPNAHMEFTGPMHDHFYNFFLLADQFPALEVLRLITRVETPEDEHFQFEEYMFQIGNRLKSWARLRKLIMCFRVEGEWFHWDSTPNTKTQSILDSPLPPSEQDLDWISNDELARLCDDPDLATTCVDSLAAQTPVDDPVAESDIIDRLMRIWRLRNGERMEKVMNNLWKCCPTLRQVDWYPWNTDVSDDYGVETLCRWSYVPQVNAGITEDGQDPHQVVWDLLWKGCPEGDPDPLMTIRVGQEWERELDILSM